MYKIGLLYIIKIQKKFWVKFIFQVHTAGNKEFRPWRSVRDNMEHFFIADLAVFTNPHNFMVKTLNFNIGILTEKE